MSEGSVRPEARPPRSCYRVPDLARLNTFTRTRSGTRKRCGGHSTAMPTPAVTITRFHRHAIRPSLNGSFYHFRDEGSTPSRRCAHIMNKPQSQITAAQ